MPRRPGSNMNEQNSRNTTRQHRHAAVYKYSIFALGAAGLLGFVAWRALLPENPPSALGVLTQQDKREIAGACRRHTVRFAMERLRNRQFGWFFRSARVLFQQKIDRFIDDHDGTYRVYVVTYDKQAADGFSPWYRHQMVKTNGHWTILRSY